MCLSPIFLQGFSFPIPCGKCVECCVKYSDMWSQRIMDEASLHDESFFLTLTYKETDGKLVKRDLQLFFKRLRKYVEPAKIRYFAAGEYGGSGNRPHYHAAIFGWRPPDLVPVKQDKDLNTYYSSKILEKLWQAGDEWSEGHQAGFISVGDLSLKSAKYIAKYLTKLDQREHEVKPFTLMSRKPGLGYDVVKPEMLVTGVRFFNGRSFPIPKYYLNALEQQGFNVEILKARRQEIASNITPDYWQPEDFERFKKKKAYKDRELLH